MRDTAASRPPSNIPSYEYVERNALARAQNAAAELRAMFDAMSTFERTVAGKQIAVVRRLVEAVETM
ncbi:hypothetical protein JFN94_24740 [Burkholderia anthina]|uniref:Uncharacterized protein n=1 Tax=Burkholderia anthina TaxID=179879 RepID=A0A7T6VIL5_9BURK|nr:hypothetical protein [Burkholderia anthina]QQK04565.1 hypothetical protein JFN94_24740 [Burkholderia anthina]